MELALKQEEIEWPPPLEKDVAVNLGKAIGGAMNHLVSVQDTKKNKTEETWGSMTWIANQVLSGSAVAVGLLTIRAGFSNALHSHSNADEVIYVSRGTLRVKMGGSEVYLQPGDALTIPLKVVHQIKNFGMEDAEMTLSYSSGIRKYTAE